MELREMVTETTASVPQGGESSSSLTVKCKKKLAATSSSSSKGDDDDDHNNNDEKKKRQKRGGTGGKSEDRILSGHFIKHDVRKVKVERHEYTNIKLSEEVENFIKSAECRALPEEIDFNTINRCPYGLGLKEYHWYTRDEYEIYREVVKESKGFDLPFMPFSIERANMISSMDLTYKIDAREMAKYSKLALLHYNKKNGTDFVFEKLVKANSQAACGFIYYITFMAKSTPSTNSTSFATFQARVHRLIEGGVVVALCRIKP
ncbi:hypothetical protein LguiB_002691 [Lonicera macranthoides]